MGVLRDLLFFYFYIAFDEKQLTDLKKYTYRVIKGTHGAMITLYNYRHEKIRLCRLPIHLWSLYAQSHNIIFIMPFHYLRSSFIVALVVKKLMRNAEN